MTNAEKPVKEPAGEELEKFANWVDREIQQLSLHVDWLRRLWLRSLELNCRESSEDVDAAVRHLKDAIRLLRGVAGDPH